MMRSPPPHITPAYARFGWYWQPEQWLSTLTEKSVIESTAKAIDLKSKKQHLLEQIENEKKAAEERYRQQKKLLDSLFQDQP